MYENIRRLKTARQCLIESYIVEIFQKKAFNFTLIMPYNGAV